LWCENAVSLKTMDTRNYWLDLFTGTTWQEFLDAGSEVSGFRERRRKTVQQIKRGDYLLCYLTGVSRWIGVLEVVIRHLKPDFMEDLSESCEVEEV